MRAIRNSLIIATLIAANAANGAEDDAIATTNLMIAEAFVDAFYSFEGARLKDSLASAPESSPEILYYQGWAQGGHYSIVKRQPCRIEEAGVACSITVEDDLIKALGFRFHVTDTFHLTISNGTISRVSTSSDDPPEFHEALEWVKTTHADRFEASCRGFFAGGPTPQECVQTVVAGFKEYAAAHLQPGSHSRR